MTEAEWQSCTDPKPMFDWLLRGGGLSHRKARLFAVACWRRVWGHLDEAARRAVEVAERYAGGEATVEELAAAARGAARQWRSAPTRLTGSGDAAGRAAAEVAGRAASTRVWASIRSQGVSGRRVVADELGVPADVVRDGRDAFRWVEGRERAGQADLLRDLAGDPFRPLAIDPTWVTTTAVSLARSIYDERAFDRMPILADALEEVGCDNDDVLAHCRQPSDHVRGCWVVDLVLGQS